MRVITDIVIHCSATREGQEFTAKDIDQWHKNRGWAGIGYHYVILLDGTIEKGRPDVEIGAHVKGHNARSIGICYIGGLDAWGNPKDTRTPWQKIAMAQLVNDLMETHKGARVLGHRDYPGVAKDCPCFDVVTWWVTARNPSMPVTPKETKETKKAHQVILIDHVVSNGETLWGIASKYGVTIDDIYVRRLMFDNGYLQPGEKLLVVQKGGEL